MFLPASFVRLCLPFLFNFLCSFFVIYYLLTMDTDLYDEFGNYVGPELDSEDEEEEEQEQFGDDEERNEYDVSYLC